jgi:hydroxymethylbilane synthase
VVSGDALRFHGLVLRPDGSDAFEARRSGAVADAAALGADAGAALKAAAPADIFLHE